MRASLFEQRCRLLRVTFLHELDGLRHQEQRRHRSGGIGFLDDPFESGEPAAGPAPVARVGEMETDPEDAARRLGRHAARKVLLVGPVAKGHHPLVLAEQVCGDGQPLEILGGQPRLLVGGGESGVLGDPVAPGQARFRVRQHHHGITSIVSLV